ncbi:protein of unknown function [Candidatus Filomicrobium marinum]|uniref:Transposase n=1 Tax=Candidatus Filomicrobium marinum TaxID=1608628 RepID=A0A0D6JIQ6_9HYPH|nr:protein of unknown function [Candidatus Filomicrobium marinum]
MANAKACRDARLRLDHALVGLIEGLQSGHCREVGIDAVHLLTAPKTREEKTTGTYRLSRHSGAASYL